MNFLPSLFIFALATLFSTEEPPITADLRNPKYKDGIFSTHLGGVIRGKDLRIQAKNLQYTQQKENHRLEASGDLLFQYQGHVFIGSALEYDFITRSGVLYDGKSFASPWYLGGEKIEIQSDGSYQISDAFFTTCENRNSSWDLYAGKVSVLKEGLLSAEKLRIRLLKVPVFALPSFKVNLKKFKEPIFRYSVDWDKSRGPRISARYQFYSWDTAALYGRFEYRVGTGFGGAFETEYASLDKRTTFVTRSYLGSDILENAPDKQRRYRLQGMLNSSFANNKTKTVLSWDKYSDVRMPNDFKSDDFEVNTAKQTLFSLRHQEKMLIFSLKARPRVNPFESLKQDLPTLFLSLRPLEFGGAYFDFISKASYLNFVYSDRLIESIHGLRSIRLEARPRLYRPFHMGPLTLTPCIGNTTIFYNKSPSHTPKTVATFFYGGSLTAKASHSFKTFSHVFQPYFDYYGYTTPTVSSDDHYIFSIQDGYARINQLQAGLRNSFYSSYIDPVFKADLYANAFFGNTPINPTVYKLYLFLGWQFPSLELSLLNAWNFRHKTVDFSNALFRWTINENAAFTLEVRYRSPYDWRKADRDNFILDAYRPESTLLSSPLSDQRVTILTHFFFRLNPFWECHLQSHHGYVNKTPQNPYSKLPYNEFKIDLFTWIASSWKLRLSYTHTEKDDRFTTGIQLMKK